MFFFKLVVRNILSSNLLYMDNVYGLPPSGCEVGSTIMVRFLFLSNFVIAGMKPTGILTRQVFL